MGEEEEFYVEDEPLEEITAAFENAEKGLTAKPKRRVSYNQEAVLCPDCMKRIRLNNNGRVRVHASGKAGSNSCKGSNADPKDQIKPDYAGLLAAISDNVDYPAMLKNIFSDLA